MNTIIARLVVAAASTLGPIGHPAPAQSPREADEGRQAYTANCAMCHGVTLGGGGFAPPLNDATFLNKWAGASQEALSHYIATRMPPAAPGSLTPAMHTALVEYVDVHSGLASAR